MTLSHQIKLARADKHLHALDRAIKDFVDYEPYEIEAKFDPDSGYYIFRVESHEDPAAEFSVIIGDVLSNLRSALDHLAFALNLRGGPLPNPKVSQFPIFKDPDDFARRAPQMIPNVRGAARTEVEALQPYHGGVNSFLWELNELCSADKHRLLHVVNVVWGHTEAYFGSDDTVFDVPSMRFRVGVIKDNAEILRCRPGRHGVVPKPEMYVKFKLTCEVTFDQAPTPGSPVWNTLYSLRWFVKEGLPRLGALPVIPPSSHPQLIGAGVNSQRYAETDPLPNQLGNVRF